MGARTQTMRIHHCLATWVLHSMATPATRDISLSFLHVPGRAFDCKSHISFSFLHVFWLVVHLIPPGSFIYLGVYNSRVWSLLPFSCIVVMEGSYPYVFNLRLRPC